MFVTYNKYQKKDKQKIIRFINQAVREKKQEDSYRRIEVWCEYSPNPNK